MGIVHGNCARDTKIWFSSKLLIFKLRLPPPPLPAVKNGITPDLNRSRAQVLSLLILRSFNDIHDWDRKEGLITTFKIRSQTYFFAELPSFVD